MRLTDEMETISSSGFKDYPMNSIMGWSYFTFFDKKPLHDLDWLMGRLVIEDYEWEKKKRLIILCTEKGLIPNFEMENGSRGYPPYAFSRIHFFDKLIENWQYNIRKLKNIADNEDLLIDALYSNNEFHNRNLSDFEFYLLFLKRGAEDDERLLKSKDNLPKRELIKENFEKFKKLIVYLEQTKYENLYEKEKNQMVNIVSSIKKMMGHQMIDKILSYRSKCLLGFSPNVEFQNSFSDVGGHSDISRDEYPYLYKDGLQKYYFGNWGVSEEFLIDKNDFFATPEFLIEYSVGNGVHINIRDPEKVDSHYMRRIDKIYTEVRKSFRPPRKGWGEKSGRKKTLEKRDELIKDLYKNIRDAYPKKSMDVTIKEVLESIAKDCENISFYTAKRIIHSSKKE